tara:strand:+ start:259 stop:468 length:210 start_codon:yes stop_codon:yes gene_type:complete
MAVLFWHCNCSRGEPLDFARLQDFIANNPSMETAYVTKANIYLLCANFGSFSMLERRTDPGSLRVLGAV